MTQQQRGQTRRTTEPTPSQEAEARDETPFRPAATSLSHNPPRDADTGKDDDVVEVQGVYIISVAARILDMHPQTLRKYERLGLVQPGRTLGMLRLYSSEDIRKLRLIRHLSDEMGLNLAGVEFVLTAVENLLTMKKRLAARLGPQAGEAVEDELELLFRSLNLPVDQ